MRIDIMAKILVAVYERAEQAEQTAEQLADLGIAQHDMSVLSPQGSRPAGFLGDAQSGEGLVRKLLQSGIPQDQAELYAQGVEHGLSLVVARVENDRAEQAGQVMERQPLVEIEARVEQWADLPEGAEEETVQAVEEELHVGKRQTRGGRIRLHTSVEERPVEDASPDPAGASRARTLCAS
jgi:hypothetical protein